MAEGVGLLPTIDKALKINERFRRYVLQDYRTSVPVGKSEFFRSEPTCLAKRRMGVNEIWFFRKAVGSATSVLRNDTR
jgi:hypothetical protein